MPRGNLAIAPDIAAPTKAAAHAFNSDVTYRNRTFPSASLVPPRYSPSRWQLERHMQPTSSLATDTSDSREAEVSRCRYEHKGRQSGRSGRKCAHFSLSRFALSRENAGEIPAHWGISSLLYWSQFSHQVWHLKASEQRLTATASPQ